MAKKYTAQCACGANKFEFNTHPTFIAVCHCLDCKKATGGEAATFFGGPEDDFTLTSGKPKAFHYVAQSSKGGQRQAGKFRHRLLSWWSRSDVGSRRRQELDQANRVLPRRQ